MSERVNIHLENHIANVRLNRPDKMNALDKAMFEGIVEAQGELASNPDIRAVVLSGEGKSFCAGLDISAMMAQQGGADSGDSPDKLASRTHGNTNIFQEVALGWRKLPAPVIAAVHGVCFGGGLQIASGADVRIVTPDARLSVMELRWGLIPDMAGFALWRGYVRDDVLREMTYTNREFSGSEARDMGFATHVEADPLSRALAIAEDIVGKNPDAIRSAKDLFNRYQDLDEDQILQAESELQDTVIGKPNQVEAVMANLEKRAPDFEV